jgi:3-deoxy-D-manno-octulosonic-acid transferase
MLSVLYTTLLYLLAPLALGTTALRGLRDPAYRDRLGERLGCTRVRFATPPIWVHAVSVGEVQAAAVLVRALRTRFPQYSLLITTATPTGAQRVRALFPNGVQHAYLPYDLPGAVRRFLDATRPAIAIVMEREIWPNLFAASKRRGIPILLASARMSARSAQRQRRYAGLFARALSGDVVVAAQTGADAERYRAIGAEADHVYVTGNVKFDLEVPEDVRAAGHALRVARFAGRPVWIAGSTLAGEEDVLLEAHARARARIPELLLVLVPRHPNRFAEVRSWLASRQVCYASRAAQAPVEAQTSVLLVDTLGELLMFYAAADVAFVGGSLVPVGGHNLLEPAALARPILVGPHNFNGPEIADLLLAAGAAVQVGSAHELAASLVSLIPDEALRAEMGAKAQAIVAANRGALERVMRLIEARLA